MLAIQRQPTDGNKFVENGMRGILRVPRANVIIKRIIQRMLRRARARAEGAVQILFLSETQLNVKGVNGVKRNIIL